MGDNCLRPDSHQWPTCLDGRVSSAVLPCGSTDILVISVYMPVGNGEALRLRAQCIEAIAQRVHVSDLLCIVAGDWNCPPYSPELAALSCQCNYAHDLIGVTYHSTADHCIDFAFVKPLPVIQVFQDMKVSDHWGIMVQVQLPCAAQFDALLRFPHITCSAADWQLGWQQCWPS